MSNEAVVVVFSAEQFEILMQRLERIAKALERLAECEAYGQLIVSKAM